MASKAILVPAICSVCDGSGSRGRCENCLGLGLIPKGSPERAVSKAWLCEHCGVRAYDRTCTAPDGVCKKAQERTEFIRSGYVFVQERAMFPDVTPSRTPMRVSMDQALDQLEDLRIVRDRAADHLAKMITAAQLVTTSGKPWWRALVDAVYPWEVAPLEHAYAMVAGYTHTPDHIDCEPPERIVSKNYPCRWLVSALAQGFPVRYSAKQGELVQRLLIQDKQIHAELDYP